MNSGPVSISRLVTRLMPAVPSRALRHAPIAPDTDGVFGLPLSATTCGTPRGTARGVAFGKGRTVTLIRRCAGDDDREPSIQCNDRWEPNDRRFPQQSSVQDLV